MTATSVAWTEERIATITERWKNGDSASAIAASLTYEARQEITRNAVLGKLKRLGVMRKGSRPIAQRVKRPRPEPKPRVLRIPKAQTVIEPDPEVDLSVFRSRAWEPLERSLSIPLERLTESTCKWPLGRESPYLFCGDAPIDGKPYCAIHARMATGHGTISERVAAR